MHTDRCIRSDGDVFCAAGCTHDRDEAQQAIKDERDRLRKALEWYADEGRYMGHKSRYGQYIPADAEEDRGARARRALGR